MPEEAALDMLRFVKRIVRDQQRCPNCDGRADDKVGGRRRHPTATPPTRARPLGRFARRLTPRVPRASRRQWARYTPSARPSWRRGARAAGTSTSWAARGGAAGLATMPTCWCGTSRRRRAGAAAGRTARSGYSPMCSRLPPHVFEAAAPSSKPQPCVLEAVTPCVSGCDLVFRGCGPM